MYCMLLFLSGVIRSRSRGFYWSSNDNKFVVIGWKTRQKKNCESDRGKINLAWCVQSIRDICSSESSNDKKFVCDWREKRKLQVRSEKKTIFFCLHSWSDRLVPPNVPRRKVLRNGFDRRRKNRKKKRNRRTGTFFILEEVKVSALFICNPRRLLTGHRFTIWIRSPSSRWYCNLFRKWSPRDSVGPPVSVLNRAEQSSYHFPINTLCSNN